MINSSFKKHFGFIFTVLLVLAFFAPKLIFLKIPVPADSILGLYHPFRDIAAAGYSAEKFPAHNPLITDPVLQIYPWKKLTVENIKKLNLPLWNPYSFSGQPLLANMQSATFSVYNLPFLILPFNLAWGIQIILITTAICLFMYLFLVNKGLAKISALFGAVVLTFSGFSMSWMTWGTIIATFSWLPLMLLSIDKFFEKKSRFYLLILVFATAQTIFSGHLQTAFYVLAASAAYLILAHFKRKDVKKTLVLSLALFSGVLITSVQTLPTIEFIRYSTRDTDQLYNESRKDWFLPTQNLIGLLAPDFFGNPATYNYWGVFNYAEFSIYLGIFPLFLAIVAILKSKHKTFFILISFVALVLAIKNPLSKVPFALNFPFISSAQPSRIISLLLFGLSAMSAYGLEIFLKEKRKALFLSLSLLILLVCLTLAILTFFPQLFPNFDQLDPPQIARRNLVLPTLLAALLLAIAFLKDVKIMQRVIIYLIFAITIFDLFRFAYKFTPFSKISLLVPKTKTTEFLNSQQKPFRIMATDRRIMHPNSSTPYKIESISGYDPLFLKSYAQLISTMESQTLEPSGHFNRIVTPQNYSSPITNLLNTKYILTFDEIQNPGFTKVFQEGATKVYQNNNALPRAFFAEKIKKVQNPQEELLFLLNSDLKLEAASLDLDFNGTSKNYHSIEFKKYQDQNFTIEVDSQTEAPLIISNIFYPGWQARIDNHPTKIFRVDYTLQALIVPPGKHLVDFYFQPQSFYNGLYISTASLILVFILLKLLWKKIYP